MVAHPECLPAIKAFSDEALLGELMVALYRAGTDTARAGLEVHLVSAFRRGAWQGFKRIYKLSEATGDHATWLPLAFRVDTERIMENPMESVELPLRGQDTVIVPKTRIAKVGEFVQQYFRDIVNPALITVLTIDEIQDREIFYSN